MHSQAMLNKVSLQTVDYIVLVVVLIIPLGIGVYFAIKDAKRLTRDVYLLGGRRMAMVPVLMSLFVTFQSAISLIGMPTETYIYGPLFVGIYIGSGISCFIAAFSVTPLFYPLRITSIYEYIDMRYKSKTVRLISTLLGMIQMFFYLAVVLLAPGLALEAAAGIPFWLSVVIVGGTGTIYTMAGGIKSVVWTDTFQTFFFFLGIFAVIIKLGGVEKSWHMAEAGGRTNFDKFTFDLRIRHTWYGVVICGFVTGMVGVFNQSTSQRISSLKSHKHARNLMILNGILSIFYGFCCILVGWCMYSYFFYIRCDPFKAGILRNPNQMTPFFVIHSMQDLSGFAGIYMSSLFSGALSTLSSGINALAANTVEDILEKPMKSVSEKTATTITKIAVSLYGTAVVIVAFLAKNLKGQVTQMSVSIFGTFGSSVLGVFLLGCTIPWVNKYGAISGAVISLAFNLWLAVGNKLHGRKPPILEFGPIDMCYNKTTLAPYLNDSTSTHTTRRKSIDSLPETFSPYDISYEWYSIFGLLVCYIVGVIVSRLTRHIFPNKTEPKLIIPCLRETWGLHSRKIAISDNDNLFIERRVSETKITF